MRPIVFPPLFSALKARIQVSLEAKDLLSLQRTLGNQAVQRLLEQRALQQSGRPALQGRTVQTNQLQVQRTYRDNPDEFISWIQEQEFYTSQIRALEGSCAGAAKTIGNALAERGFSIQYRGILVFPPNKASIKLNRNHFVVVVTINGTKIIIDPIQSQFEGGHAQVAKEDEWIRQFKKVKVQMPVKPKDEMKFVKVKLRCSDFNDFASANNYAKNRAVSYKDASGKKIN
ncbi:MAG: hypothetical protein KatS3mg057_2415 [Herpetosiphonaceae bacterium]|nr:MAG: hypothetical protein KatS3mg057_2415 [Herpetosiphonaceae bacterium]